MLKKEILRTIKYFSFFNYPPSFEEIYTFLPKKCSKEELRNELDYLVKQKKLLTFNFKLLTSVRYTVGRHSIKNQNSKVKIQNENEKLKINKTFFDKFLNRYQISQEKLKNWRFRVYLKILSFFPQIKLVGLSGSMAMMNAKEGDDIDLFIITAKNRLFTGRFIAVILAKFLGLYRRRFSPGYQSPMNQSRRKVGMVQGSALRNLVRVETSSVSPGSASAITNYKNKLCLNLFFDENNLSVPNFKKTEYVAHEILQMKPIIVKGNIYQQFLRANRWVYKIFPNAGLSISNLKAQSSKPQLKIKNYFKNFKFLNLIFNFSFLTFNFLANKVEQTLKSFQLLLIRRHQTTEIITDSQLWFHPEDFENNLIMKFKWFK